MSIQIRARLGHPVFLFSCSTMVAAALLASSEARAQIKEPGTHARYAVELEPHALLWWGDRSHHWDDALGMGAGLRVSIPILQDGFVKSINNSVALGVGADWGRYDHRCWWRDDRNLDGRCVNNEFWLPVVMQWNFFITESFSVFGEPGLALRHSRWTWEDGYCSSAAGPVACDFSDSETGLEPAFYAGGRVGNETVAFTFRVGWPYASVGASFFL